MELSHVKASSIFVDEQLIFGSWPDQNGQALHWLKNNLTY